MSSSPGSSVVITPEQLLEDWQGHRRLTRRVIDAFPEESLFKHSIGGMRPFSALVMEMVKMAVPILRGEITGQWTSYDPPDATTKAELLALWDKATADIDRMWPDIPPQRFQEVDTAFGQWTMPGYAMFLYAIDNEIHHRGQGYVYLRSLGIEPPPFYVR
ncbi:MAG TPA: DinB family protein [Gemmatimonadaceae bacterium]|nr:DinB family protein [Gemmatimonadaceae bacterium]